MQGFKQALTLINSVEHSHNVNYLISGFDISCCAIRSVCYLHLKRGVMAD